MIFSNPVFIHKFFSILLIFCSIFNIGLNTILIYIIVKKCGLLTTEVKLILGLCVFELFEGLHMLLLTFIESIVGISYLTNQNRCQIFGFFMHTFFRLEILIVTFLSMLRYLMIFHKIERGLKFWIGVIIIGSVPCVSIFLYAAIIKNYKPTPSSIQCLPYLGDDKFSIRMMLLTAANFLIPCWITTYCYFAIGWKVSRQLKTLKSEAETNGDIEGLNMIKRVKRKLVLQLVMVFFIYNLLFMISYITMILKFAIGFKRTPFLDALILLMVNSSICLNPLITISFQPELNNELKILLVKVKAKCKKLFKHIFSRQ